MKRLPVTAAAGFLGFGLIVACGGGSGTFFSGDTLLGSWEPISISSGNQSSGCPGGIDLGGQSFDCADQTITFKTGMILTVHNNVTSQDQTGTWNLVGNVLTMTVDDSSQSGVVSQIGLGSQVDFTKKTPSGEVVIRLKKL